MPASATSPTVRSIVPSPPRDDGEVEAVVGEGGLGHGEVREAGDPGVVGRQHDGVAVLGQPRVQARATSAASGRSWWTSSATRLDGGHGSVARATARRSTGAGAAAGPGGATAWSRNSTLPSAPRKGETMASMMVAPAASKAAPTAVSASARSAGSRMTPRPFDAAARPGLELRLDQHDEVGGGRG